MGYRGRLGYGNETDRYKPSGSVPIGEPVLQVTAGLSFTCVLLEGGRVRCWGDNSSGQLGYGHVEAIGDSETPAQAALPGPLGEAPLGGDILLGGLGVVQISAMADASSVCALFGSSGAVRCWGRNDYGELGYGHAETLGTSVTPDLLAGRFVNGRHAGGDLELGSPALALSVGGRCALVDSGDLYCWGSNLNAQLGLPSHVPTGTAGAEPIEMGPVIWE
jgi:alpha-tubulin suppressor-like RCC1 family protein